VFFSRWQTVEVWRRAAEPPVFPTNGFSSQRFFQPTVFPANGFSSQRFFQPTVFRLVTGW